MPKIKNTQSPWRASINYQRRIAPKIDGKIIIETRNLKFWAFEHVRLKRYWRNKMEKCIRAIQKNFHNFLIFLRMQRNSRMEYLQASRCWKAAHSKLFDQISVKYEGSTVLRYGVISDWKMKFLQSVIENFSGFYKNFYYRWCFFLNYLTDPDRTCQALALISRPRN